MSNPRGKKLNGWQQHLRFKEVVPRMNALEEFRREDLAGGNITREDTVYITKILLKEGVIKRVRFDISVGRKAPVYKKVKPID